MDSQIVFPRSALVAAPEPDSPGQESGDSQVMAILRTMLNPAILRDPKFLLIGISNAFGFLGFYIPFMFLPSMAASQESLQLNSTIAAGLPYSEATAEIITEESGK